MHVLAIYTTGYRSPATSAVAKGETHQCLPSTPATVDVNVRDTALESVSGTSTSTVVETLIHRRRRRQRRETAVPLREIPSCAIEMKERSLY